MRFTKLVAPLGLLLAAGAPAMAQTPGHGEAYPQPLPMEMGTAWDAFQGWYAGLNLGAGWGTTTGDLTANGCLLATGCGPNGPPSFNRSINFSGPLGGIQGGYNWHFSPLWMLGIEADFDGSGVSARGGTNVVGLSSPPFQAGSTATTNVGGSQHWLTTVRGRLGWVARPDLLLFITGGFAAAEQHASASVTFNTPGVVTNGTGLSATRSGTRDGWAAGGGVEYAFAPGWSLTGEYLRVDLGHESVGAVIQNPPPGVVPVGYHTSFSTGQNILRAAINYHFYVPPPPPAPVAMPAPPPPAPKVFIVFFDWDKDVVTPEGHAIIQQAADAWRAGAPVQLQVTGYTDRSGSPGYNQRLSERRANNVARALAALGVPQNEMIVAGRGENDNRVPTAPGVREPQNRRVEIVSP